MAHVTGDTGRGPPARPQSAEGGRGLPGETGGRTRHIYPQMLKASTNIVIRFADCDPMGHVNNAVYFTYMEQARVELFKKVFELQVGEMKSDHFPFILAEISCRFLKPTRFDQSLTIFVEVAEVKKSSFVFHYELKDAPTGEMVADGRSVQVWYDYKAGKPIPIPEEIKKKLEMNS